MDTVDRSLSFNPKKKQELSEINPDFEKETELPFIKSQIKNYEIEKGKNNRRNFEIAINSSEKDDTICVKINNLHKSKLCHFIFYALILLLFILSFYLFSEMSFYKNIYKNKPKESICLTQFAQIKGQSQNQNTQSQDEQSDGEIDIWEEKGKELVRELIAKIDTEDWILYKKTDGLNYYTKIDNDLLKSNGTLSARPEILKKIIFDHYEDMQDWDPYVVNSTIIKQFNPKTRINYYKESKMGVSRDFITFSYWDNYKDGFIIGFKSITLEDEASFVYSNDDDNTVRAYFEVTGSYLIPSEDGESTMYNSVADVDLKMDFLPFKTMILINSAKHKMGITYKRAKILEESLKNNIM